MCIMHVGNDCLWSSTLMGIHVQSSSGWSLTDLGGNQFTPQTAPMDLRFTTAGLY